MSHHSSPNGPDAQALLNQIVADFRKDQKRQRIWAWIKRILIVILLVFLYYQWFGSASPEELAKDEPHVGLIDLKGVLSDSDNGSAENFAKGMAAAYKAEGLKALIVRINSPGGSPVQADYMYETIRYYREKFPKIKVYAVCVDVCASGAYYAASAAERIYANKSSMVGSIGVIYSGFGFVDALQKLGVTRRLQTAGANKAFMDPFSSLNPKSQTELQGMLDAIHQEFIKKVQLGRGKRLKAGQETFSGLSWVGDAALERGLIDGFSSAGQLARNQIGLDSVIEYTYKQSMLERMTKGIGMALAESIPEVLGAFRQEAGFKAQVVM